MIGGTRRWGWEVQNQNGCQESHRLYRPGHHGREDQAGHGAEIQGLGGLAVAIQRTRLGHSIKRWGQGQGQGEDDESETDLRVAALPGR